MKWYRIKIDNGYLFELIDKTHRFGIWFDYKPIDAGWYFATLSAKYSCCGRLWSLPYGLYKYLRFILKI